jgi:hypothetical protein
MPLYCAHDASAYGARYLLVDALPSAACGLPASARRLTLAGVG